MTMTYAIWLHMDVHPCWQVAIQPILSLFRTELSCVYWRNNPYCHPFSSWQPWPCPTTPSHHVTPSEVCIRSWWFWDYHQWHVSRVECTAGPKHARRSPVQSTTTWQHCKARQDPTARDRKQFKNILVVWILDRSLTRHMNHAISKWAVKLKTKEAQLSKFSWVVLVPKPYMRNRAELLDCWNLHSASMG